MPALRIQRKMEQIQDRLENDNLDTGTRESLNYTLNYLSALDEAHQTES